MQHRNGTQHICLLEGEDEHFAVSYLLLWLYCMTFAVTEIICPTVVERRGLLLTPNTRELPLPDTNIVLWPGNMHHLPNKQTGSNLVGQYRPSFLAGDMRMLLFLLLSVFSLTENVVLVQITLCLRCGALVSRGVSNY